MKATKLSKAQQTMLAVGMGVVAGLYIYAAYILKPMWHTATKLKQEIQTTTSQLQHIEQVVAQAPRLRAEHEGLSNKLQSLRTALPPEEELPTVIERLSEMANRSGVKIQTIFPQRTADSASSEGSTEPVLYRVIPIQIDAAAGFHQLGAFMSLVESGTQPVQLKHLRISQNPRDPRRHTVKLIFSVYFTAPEVVRPSS